MVSLADLSLGLVGGAEATCAKCLELYCIALIRISKVGLTKSMICENHLKNGEALKGSCIVV